ncbi:hypothetical protein DI005_09875 [Prauserella sp. PE36]|uniref:hypothetical protein n=1 Tax=Prauserella sp. PE36 TaxID=1504709 RepID=UPI000DE45146|nr:hypothetical protein [Prauserella sp. PE36]RBM21568.1 hypothetical protein DI005_09875 [Prauserella sp. PE36]
MTRTRPAGQRRAALLDAADTLVRRDGAGTPHALRERFVPRRGLERDAPDAASARWRTRSPSWTRPPVTGVNRCSAGRHGVTEQLVHRQDGERRVLGGLARRCRAPGPAS